MAQKPSFPPTGAKRITVRDIAAQAGVHFTTVSLALRNHPRLPLATRRKIQKIAARLGYRPDPMVTALNAYRSSSKPAKYQATIGWINNWPVQNELLSIPEFHEYFKGARSRTDELGYLLEEFWMHEPGLSGESLGRILRARNITALLIAPQPFAATPLKLNYQELSAVAFGYSLKPSLLHVVTSHHFHSMNLIMERLVSYGYRRPGLIYPAAWDEKAENSCQGGMALAWRRWPELEPVNPLLKTEVSDADIQSWMQAERPDSVISYNPMADRLQTLGYRFPKDLGFVSLDLKHNETFLSGTHQNDALIGRTAVDLLVAMLHRGERGVPKTAIRTLVESIWLPGKTLARKTSRRAR